MRPLALAAVIALLSSCTAPATTPVTDQPPRQITQQAKDSALISTPLVMEREAAAWLRAGGHDAATIQVSEAGAVFVFMRSPLGVRSAQDLANGLAQRLRERGAAVAVAFRVTSDMRTEPRVAFARSASATAEAVSLTEFLNLHARSELEVRGIDTDELGEYGAFFEGAAALKPSSSLEVSLGAWLEAAGHGMVSVQELPTGSVFVFTQPGLSIRGAEALFRETLMFLREASGATPAAALVHQLTRARTSRARITYWDPSMPEPNTLLLSDFMRQHAHGVFDTDSINPFAIGDYELTTARTPLATVPATVSDRPQGPPGVCRYISTPTTTRYVCFNPAGLATYKTICDISIDGDTYTSSCTTRRW